MEKDDHRVMIIGSIMIFPLSRKVLVDHHTSDGVDPVKLVRLQQTEFLILKYMATKVEHWVTKKELMEIFWPTKDITRNNATVALSRIRKELRTTRPGVERQLATAHGKGFKLSALEQ